MEFLDLENKGENMKTDEELMEVFRNDELLERAVELLTFNEMLRLFELINNKLGRGTRVQIDNIDKILGVEN